MSMKIYVITFLDGIGYIWLGKVNKYKYVSFFFYQIVSVNLSGSLCKVCYSGTGRNVKEHMYGVIMGQVSLNVTPCIDINSYS